MHGGSSDHNLYTWALPLASGSLTIDSALATAVFGTTGSVDRSWSGSTSGVWHIATVTHTRDSGSLGMTLTNVDNR